MGVSPVDVQTYVRMLSGYIYGIIITIIAVIIMMIAAHFLKKGNRGLVRWTSLVAGISIIAIIANMIGFGPLHDNLSALMNGLGTVSEESAAASEATIPKVGEEGIVLVQNDGLLPLTNQNKINVFGWAATNSIYGVPLILLSEHLIKKAI